MAVPHPRRRLRVDPTLIRILTEHTATPDDAWFFLWAGYGGIGPIPPDVTLLWNEIREYLVYRGPLSAWDAMAPWPFARLADSIWPDDRAWFLGSDTDLDWGYVGASEECIAAIEREPALRAVRVSPADEFPLPDWAS